ncbi:MAG: metallophosphoesterase [Promethearchaeota archaeon]
MNELRMENNERKSFIFRLIVSILGIIGVVFLIIILFWVVDSYKHEITHQFSIIYTTIAFSIISFIAILILDRNQKINKLVETKKGWNFKWIIILPLSFLPQIILFFYYLKGTDFEQDIFSSINLDFFVFGLTSIIGFISVVNLYFSLKNLRESIELSKKLRQHTNRLKFRIFAFYALSFMIFTTYGMIYAYQNLLNFPPPTITAGNGHTDGPWLNYYNNNPDTSIAVSWLTTEYKNTELIYGTSPTNLNMTAYGEPGYLHHVFLSGLLPNTTYYYKINENFEQDHIFVYPNVFNFTTATSKQVNPYFKFAFVGDMQPDNDLMITHNKIVAEGLLNGDFNFICQLGDMADSGTDVEDWHKLFEAYSLYASHTPTIQTIGNHDWSGGVGSSNWAALFPFPFENPRKGRYYSFDYQNAHIVSIDNFERTYTMSDEQLNWLKNDLKNAKARGQQWIFVMFHLSLMTVATSGHYFDLQKILVPIFDQYDVDFVFYAHDHDYQHYNFTYGANGHLFDPSHTWPHHQIHYFCSGGGGANLETNYGVLTMSNRVEEVTWWNTSLNAYETITYTKTKWNNSRYYKHASFTTNYTMEGEYYGKYYYNSPNEQITDEYAVKEFGFDYAEETFHYIQVEINGSQCIISARYPNGDLIAGPAGSYPQQFIFNK